MRAEGLKRPVLQAIDEEVEGAEGGSLMRLESGEDCQARLAPQVFGKVCDRSVAQHRHQEQCAEHADGIEGRASAGGGGIERGEHRNERVEIDSHQHQRGLDQVGLRSAGFTFEPFCQILGDRLLVCFVVTMIHGTSSQGFKV